MKKLDQNSFGPATDRFKVNLAAALQREGKPMKKKSISGLVLAAILVIALAATALAVSHWRDTAQQVAVMQAELGYFDTWTAEERTSLVLLLHENGAITDEPRIEQLAGFDLSVREKGELATAIMEDWIGNDAWFVTLERVAEQMNGSFTTWTAEDKAWFTQLLRESGLLSSEDIVYDAPAASDIDQETVIALARDALTDAYSLPEGYLDDFAADAMFHAPTWEVAGIQSGETIWTVEFTRMIHEDGRDNHYVLIAELDRQGNVLGHIRNNPLSLTVEFDRLSAERGPWFQWSMEDQAAFSKVLPGMVAERQAAGEEVDNYMLALSRIRFGLPGEGDMTGEEATQAVIGYVKEHYGATDKGLEKLQPYVSFDITDSENPIWRVKLLPFLVESYEHYESTGYVVHIDARTGDVILSLNRPQDDIGAIELI